MNKHTTVRAAVTLALISAAPAVFAQAVPPDPIVGQLVENAGAVTNLNTYAAPGSATIDGSAGILGGTSATVSVSATGAVGSVSVSAINSPLPSPAGGFGGVTQTVTNDVGGTVINQPGSIAGGGTSSLGTGGSAAVSASGAVAAVSVSAVTDGTNSGFSGAFTAPAFGGPVTQTTTNNGLVENQGGSITGFASLGTGASASVSATGAVAALSFSSVSDVSVSGGAPGSLTLPTVGTVTQEVNNGGFVSNTGGTISVGNLGTGASASSSATGAVASVSISGVGTTNTGGTFGGGIQQEVNNTSGVSNTAASISAGGLAPPPSTGPGIVGNSIGTGASLSASATGAVASVSYSNIGGTTGGATYTGTTTQNVLNTGAVSNTDGTITLSPYAGSPIVGVGEGASLSVGATGAVGSVSVSGIGATVGTGTSYGAIEQNVVNAYTPSGIVNSGTINAGSANFGGPAPFGLSGDGASASVSATGAVGSVGFSFVDAAFVSGGTPVVSTGSIDQTPISNQAPISNTGSIALGQLYGAGSTASIGATGAVGSVSYSSVGSTGDVVVPQFGTVYQNVENGSPTNAAATITNNGSITIAGLPGTGSSASVSGTGSVASFSVSSVADTTPVGATVVPSITQASYNGAAIQNNGSISFSQGGLTGAGSSASVAATGAVASASFRSVH